MEFARPRLPSPVTSIVLAVSVSFGVGCSSNKTFPARASVSATITEGTLEACNYGSDVPMIPFMGNGVATLVENGQTSSGSPAEVTCRVHNNGDGTFDVIANASVPQWGFEVEGTSISSTTQPGMVGGIFSWVGSGLQSDPISYATNGQTCTFTWTANLGFIAGGVAGHVECDEIYASGGLTTTGADGGPTQTTCGGTADFVFEGREE
jgi:hypothetical protein